MAGHGEEQADAGQRRNAHGFGPSESHVLHGVGDLEAPRRVADAHPQLGLTLTLGALQVHGARGRRDRHPAYFLGSVALLGVRGLGEVEEWQRGRVGPQALTPQVADPQLEAVRVRGLEGRVVGTQPDEPAVVVHADEQGAAAGVHERGDRLRDDGFHGVVALAGAHVPAGARLEFEGFGFAALGDLGDGVEAGARVQVRDDQGDDDDHDKGHHRGHADHRWAPHVGGCEDPACDQQASPQAPEAGEGRRGRGHRHARGQEAPHDHADEPGDNEKEYLNSDPPQQVGVLRRGPKLRPSSGHLRSSYTKSAAGSDETTLSHRRPPISASRHQRKDVCFSIERDAHSPRIRANRGTRM